MKNLFLTKTRWLVTIILLTSLSITNAWGTDLTVTLDFEGSSGSWPYNSDWSCDASSSATNHTTNGSRSAGMSVNGSQYITYNNALTNIKSVTFWINRTSSNTAQPTIVIQKSTWNGSAWSAWEDITGTSQTFSIARNTWTQKTFDFSTYKYNGKVRIKYTNTTTAIKIIDDIVITYEGSSCTGLDMSSVTATAGDRQIALSWPAVANADSYTVTCKNKSTGVAAGSIGGVTGSGPYNCTISSLTNGTEYTWSVEPVGSGTYCASNTPATGDATPNVYYTVTWNNNGSQYTTTSVASGSKPAFPDNPTSCDGTSTTFYGWTASPWSGKIDDISAKTIYTKASDMPNVTGAVTYHAVFCKGGGGSVTITNKLFTDTLTNSYATTHITADGYRFELNACKQNNQCQMRDNATLSYIAIPTLPGVISRFVATTVDNGSGGGSYTGTLHFKHTKSRGNATTNDIASVSYSGVTSMDWDVSSDNSTYTSGYLLTSAGFRMSDLTIYYGGSGSEYLTNCCTELGSINGSISLSNANNNVTASGWTATTGGHETGYTVKLYNSDKSNVISSADVSSSTFTKTFSNPGTGTYWVSVTPTSSGVYCAEGDETFSANSVTIAGDITITFNKNDNGAGGTMANQVIAAANYGQNVKLNANTYTAPSNKVFKSWNTESDGTGLSYGDESMISLTQNTTLYAQWASRYTVTLIDNGQTSTEYAWSDDDYALPDEYGSTCDDATFLGWHGGVYANHESGTSTNPTYVTGGTTVEITADTTFYAVYLGADPNGGGASGSDYTKVTSTPASWIGDYILAYDNSSTEAYVWNGTDAVSDYVTATISSNTISSVPTGGVTISILAGSSSGNYYIKVNGGTNDGKYLYGSSGNGLNFSDQGQNNTIEFDGTYGLMFYNSSSYLRFNNTSGQTRFRYYKSTTYQGSSYKEISLYKSASATVYTSKPYCCHNAETALSISAEPAVLVTSGSTAITISGGNGKTVTLGCVDENGTSHDSWLSTTTGTSATLTIPAVAKTTVYTVIAKQADNEDDSDNIICGDSVTVDVTVKKQWTITFKTIEDGASPSTYSTVNVADGDEYSLPDLSDEYSCTTGNSFAGWSHVQNASSVEYNPGAGMTAISDSTWYAVWENASGSKEETRTRYDLVTDDSSLAANDIIVLAYKQVGMKLYESGSYCSTTTGTLADDNGTRYITFADSPQEFKLSGSNSAWQLMSTATDKYLTIGNKTMGWDPDSGDELTISIVDSAATISDGTYNLQYNSSSPRFTGYSSSQKLPSIYKKNGSITVIIPSSTTYTTNNTECSAGAVIRADEGKWITSAKGQTVKGLVSVTAKGYESSGTLQVSSNNNNFAVSLAETAIPMKPAALTTTLVVEYTPSAAGTTESATITLTDAAGVATKTITIYGRSLPDEFALITKKNNKWYALPNDMNNGSGTYPGIEVTPNNNDAPSSLPSAFGNVIYSARGVADSRYSTGSDTVGMCMRLVGADSKCLWGTASTDGTHIQNYAVLGPSNGDQYEWLLSTTDGETYTIALPAHRDFAAGRMLYYNGSFFAQYKNEGIFYIVTVGCSTQPYDVQVSPLRVQATFAYRTNATTVHIEAGTNEAMSENRVTIDATSSPVILTGLNEKTTYYYKMTPDEDTDCAYTGTFTTTGPTIDVVEWQDSAAIIYVDKNENYHPQVIIQGEVEHGTITGGNQATELFFSKYFEADGENKLLAIYNGTPNNIYLDNYKIVNAENTLSLSGMGNPKESGYLAPHKEMIIVRYDKDNPADSCAKSQEGYGDWYVSTSAVMQFGGRTSIGLYKNDSLIDVIGSTDKDTILVKIKKPCTNATDGDLNDGPGFYAYGDNINTEEVEKDYRLSTNRCLLVRKNTVQNGDSAVIKNKYTSGTYNNDCNATVPTTFVTLATEWMGFQVGSAGAGTEEIRDSTCTGLQYVGHFDYNDYYISMDTIGEPTLLDNYVYDEEQGLYKLDLGDVSKYSCLGMTFQLQDTATKKIVSEIPTSVPILVKSNNITTDSIFAQIVPDDYTNSVVRCRTCNVVIFKGAKLTKANATAINDIKQFNDIKVYSGGELVVPEGATDFKINSLSLRRTEDTIAVANIQAKIKFDMKKGVNFDLRIDPSNWHYVALPYDCNLDDVTFSDGTKAKLGTDYRVAYYDGEYRAANKTGGWTNMNAGETLKKGHGYIISLPGGGKIKRELRFPMDTALISEESINKQVTDLHAWGGNDSELRPNHKGWNLIGNPYLVTYNNSSGTGTITTEPLAVGELEYETATGLYHIKDGTTSLRYIVRPINNGWSGYEQVTINDMEPFTAYFVQIGGDPATNQGVTFTAGRAKRSIVRRATAEFEEVDKHPVWYGINLTAPNGEKDRTALLISDNFTDDFDMMDDLEKQRGSYYQYYQYPVLASRNNYGEMAFNALPDESAAVTGVPLNFFAAQDGEYVISTDSRYDLAEVKSAMLKDGNQYYDLLAGDYKFNATRGDNTNRFTLFVRVERKQPEVATGSDNILSNGQLSLRAVGRTLLLSGLEDEADVYVYDMNGKLVNGSRSAGKGSIWRATVPAAGVYFVRVNSVDKQQTLRAIVY